MVPTPRGGMTLLCADVPLLDSAKAIPFAGFGFRNLGKWHSILKDVQKIKCSVLKKSSD